MKTRHPSLTTALLPTIGLLLLLAAQAALGAPGSPTGPSKSTFGPNPALTPVVAEGADPAAPPPAAAPTAPPDARIPISELPFAITRSGSYVVTRNLIGKANKNGIEVDADDVTIDLNGFALIGVGGSKSGIRGLAQGSGFAALAHENLRVLNGTVRGWGQYGIDVWNIENAQLDDLRVTRNGTGGMRAGTCAAFDTVTVRQNGGIGIESTDCTTVRAARVEGNAGDGIVLGEGTTVSASSACENARGIVVGAGSTVTATTASRNHSDGVVADGSTLLDTTATENGGHGVIANDGTNVRSSLASYNAYSGFLIYNFSAISDSIANYNTVNGIEMQIGGVASRNRVAVNANGIHILSANNRVESNHINNNTCGIRTEPAGASALLIENSLRSNVDNMIGQARWGARTDGPIYMPGCPEGTACLGEYAPPWANFEIQ